MALRVRHSLILIASFMAAATAAASVVGDEGTPGVEKPGRARIDYMLKCQGCHGPNGTGNEVNTPPLNGEVARFLYVEGGREFLAQVPGVASVDLKDEQLAEVLNWTLYKFDRQNIPQGFKPYTAEEVGRLRGAPLRLERNEVRARLLSKINKTKTTKTGERKHGETT